MPFPENWKYHPLLIAVGGAVLACLLAGVMRLAHCQEPPYPLAMKDHNLRAAELMLSQAGHEVKAFDGKTVATDKQRQEGTAFIFIRGYNPEGKWFCYAVEAEEGNIKRIKLYPIKNPMKSGGK
jgi:hypothetical protein